MTTTTDSMRHSLNCTDPAVQTPLGRQQELVGWAMKTAKDSYYCYSDILGLYYSPCANSMASFNSRGLGCR